MKLTIRVFICICPQIVSGILDTMWRDFSFRLLWGTMWEEFFSQCGSHCEKFVRRMWVEMNTLIVCEPTQVHNVTLNLNHIDGHKVLKYQWLVSFTYINIHMYVQFDRNGRNCVLDGPAEWYFSTSWSSMWLTFRVTLSNWVGSSVDEIFQ